MYGFQRCVTGQRLNRRNKNLDWCALESDSEVDPENRKLLDAFGVPAHAEVVVQRSFAEKLSLMWQNVFRIKFRLSLLDRPALMFRLKLGNTGTE